MVASVPFSLAGKRVFVAGHKGLAGSALVRRLHLASADVLVASREELDLRDQHAVRDWIARARPDAVVVAAAKVGGISANADAPVDFLLDNLLIETSLISGAALAGVQKLVFLASSCMYPRITKQPITEDMLLTGALEPTNEGYALAKIVGIKLCQAYRRQSGHDFISVIPCNLYGPGDRYDLVSSHVIPALIRKAHEARQQGSPHTVIWGTGEPRREFLYVDDLADAVLLLLERYSDDQPINVGAGKDHPIRELAELVNTVVGFGGGIRHDLSKPDGTPAKLLDSTRITAMGWAPRVDLSAGLRLTYEDFLGRQL